MTFNHSAKTVLLKKRKRKKR